MKKERLEALADGIFAIAITLLVIEIRIPELYGIVTNNELMNSLFEMKALFLAYILSFALLFTYWKAHNYLFSVYAKNINPTLANYNALFFFFVVLVPFSAHMLGLYGETQIGVMVLGINTICIGLALMMMRRYIIGSNVIQNDIEAITSRNMRHGTIRTVFPVIVAALAIVLSFANIQVALFLFTIAVLFNLVPSSANMVDKIFFRKALKSEQ